MRKFEVIYKELVEITITCQVEAFDEIEARMKALNEKNHLVAHKSDGDVYSHDVVKVKAIE